jgi:hypothetical protein
MLGASQPITPIFHYSIMPIFSSPQPFISFADAEIF